jgi:hypothetical protein
VHVDVVVIESDDVATAIVEEVAKDAITKLVLGASSSDKFKSKYKGMSVKVSVFTPIFCTVVLFSKVNCPYGKKSCIFETLCCKRSCRKKLTELNAIHAANEKEKLEDALNGFMSQYRMFTWDEIVSATSFFSEDLRIGIGAYGMVYKCTLHHPTVAVRILHSNGYRKSKQFQQELEILSRIRHPNSLLLLGACPGHGYPVCEYTEIVARRIDYSRKTVPHESHGWIGFK